MKARPPPPRITMSGGGVPKGRAFLPSPLYGTRERALETAPATDARAVVPALPRQRRHGDGIVGARLASPPDAPALRFALTADRASLALFGRHEQIPRLTHFAASPLTLSLVQIPPHGYALQADVGGWWSGEAVHAPIGAGRDDLLVRRDHVPEALLVVAANLSGLVLAAREFRLSERFREALAASELRAWLARSAYSHGIWRDALRMHRNGYISQEALYHAALVRQVFPPRTR